VFLEGEKKCIFETAKAMLIEGLEIWCGYTVPCGFNSKKYCI